jgi:uncharacterized membrane protein YphA (DoxX/SURF4 family)
MRIATIVARILLGLMFLVFGLNGFLHFLPMKMPPGTAGQYFLLLFITHYVLVVSFFQVLGGLLLLLNRYVALALVILGPILVNILISCPDAAQRSAYGALRNPSLGNCLLLPPPRLCRNFRAEGRLT